MKPPSSILVTVYLLVGAAGFGLSVALDANPIVETGFVFVAGLLIGFATEKFVKTRLRQARPDPTQPDQPDQ